MSKPRKSDPSIAAAQLPATDITVDKYKRQRDIPDEIELIGTAAIVAGDAMFNRNWPWKNARKHFEINPLMRTVDKHYPYAVGGPLFVDEPVTKEEVALCEIKRKAMVSEGLRYLVVTKDTTEADARAQLKGLH